MTGIHISPEMLVIAAEKLPSTDLTPGAVEDLDLTDSSFDGIFAFRDPNAESLLARKRGRWLVWTAIYPIHKPLRLRNRVALEKVLPSMEDERTTLQVIAG